MEIYNHKSPNKYLIKERSDILGVKFIFIIKIFNIADKYHFLFIRKKITFRNKNFKYFEKPRDFLFPIIQYIF